MSNDQTHDWFIKGFGSKGSLQYREYECCRKCGTMRRRDRKNLACKGIVKVTLR